MMTSHQNNLLSNCHGTGRSVSTFGINNKTTHRFKMLTDIDNTTEKHFNEL